MPLGRADRAGEHWGNTMERVTCSAGAERHRAWSRDLLVAACALLCAFAGLAWQAAAAQATYGKISVVKKNDGGNPADSFSFQTNTYPSKPAFSLLGGQSKTYEIDCNVGSYCRANTTLAITEDAKSGYTMTGAVCRSKKGSGSFPSMPTESDAVDADTTVSLSERKLNYKVSFREWVVCFVTNTRDKGTVKVVKDVVPIPGTTDAGRFDLLVDGQVKADEIADNGATPAVEVTTGTHSVTEAAGALTDLARYDKRVDCSAAGRATVSNPNGPDVSLHVGKGEAWTCVIRNTRRGGTLKVVKDLQPATDTGRFDLLIDGAVARDQAGDGDASDAVPVTAGEHTVAERAEAGTDLADYVSDVECKRNGTAAAGSASGSGPLTVSVGHGDAVVCTITNRRKASVTVRKLTQPAQSGGPAFAFSSTLPGAGSFSLAHGAERTVTVVPGAYSVTEADPKGLGYRLSGAVCTERFGTAGGTGATRTFTADPGDQIVCTYTNTRVDRTIQVRKTGPSLAYSGDRLTFGFAVTNAGNDPLTSIAVSDDKCPDVVGPSAKAGGNQDGTLDPGETWSYTCSYVATHAKGDVNPVTNTVTATGRDSDGGTVKDTDKHDTRFLHPAIDIEKTGPATATAGDLITYSMTVVNSGDSPFVDPLVLGDALCLAAPALQSKGADSTPGTLDVGDVWTYTCQVQTKAGQTEVVNTATVKGTDENDRSATDEDTFTTTLSQPPPPVEPPAEPRAAEPVAGPQPQPQIVVAPSAVVSGTAKLRGPSGCPTRTVTASVTGRRIVRVTWYLDGKRIAVRTKADAKGRWTVPVRPKGLRYGAHRLEARVQFAASSKTAPKTLRLGFGRCRPAARRPTFTG